MNKKLKVGIFLLLFFSFLIYGLFSIEKFSTNAKTFEEQKEYFNSNCEKKEYPDEYVKSFCENKYPYKLGFLSVLDYFIMKTDRLIVPIIFLTLALSLIYVCKMFKEKYLLNLLIRESYGKFIKKILKESYFYIWIVPLVMLIVTIIGGFLYGFDTNYAIHNPDSFTWQITTMKNPIIFIILYLINIILYLSTFINIGLLIARKKHNYFISLITSFLAVVALQLFLEVFINKISILNLLNFLHFSDALGPHKSIGISFIWCFSSWCLLIFAYYKKEKLFLDCDESK